MKWTKELPTREGWYWTRYDKGDEKFVNRLLWHGGFLCRDCERMTPVCKPTRREWSDSPIPEPEEA